FCKRWRNPVIFKGITDDGELSRVRRRCGLAPSRSLLPL
ncbi:unnamed protein product, partial [Brassica rapa subsp. narinosa]